MNRLVVMFGGSGFLGRYVAQRLLASGARVRFAERDPRRAFFLKPQGNLGQVQFVAADVTKPDSVARAVTGADAVINLAGTWGDMFAVHRDGAANVAKAAATAGVGALVHISAIGADAEGRSAYARSKGEGEDAVRTAFPGATIIRPSVMFGREDRFVNRFAGMMGLLPVMPVMRGKAKIQPAYVADVASAVAQAALDPGAHAGQTHELGGPQAMSFGELHALIARETGRSPALVDVPDAVGAAIARFGFLPGAPITWDQWLMLQEDNVASGEGFAAFGIAPASLATVAPGWLVQYRKQGRFGGSKASA